MPESITITDLVIEYTDDEGLKKKVMIVLNEIVSRNLGDFLDIGDYKDKIKSMIDPHSDSQAE